ERAHGGLERPEALAERHLLLVGEGLAVEDQHGMLVEGLRDARERRAVERPGQVDAGHLGGEERMSGRDVERRGGRGHGRTSWPGIVARRRCNSSCVQGRAAIDRSLCAVLAWGMASMVEPAPSLYRVTNLVYALHGLSILIGISTAATVIGAFVFGW